MFSATPCRVCGQPAKHTVMLVLGRFGRFWPICGDCTDIVLHEQLHRVWIDRYPGRQAVAVWIMFLCAFVAFSQFVLAGMAGTRMSIGQIVMLAFVMVFSVRMALVFKSARSLI